MGGASSTLHPGALGAAGLSARTAFRHACARAARVVVAGCAAGPDRTPGPAATWAGPLSGRSGLSGSTARGDSRGALVSARVNTDSFVLGASCCFSWLVVMV